MYLPAKFTETDINTIVDLIKQHPLGLLIANGQSGLTVSPLPFFYKSNGHRKTLVTHMARANPAWTEFHQSQECMVIFQGLNSYITPNWYPSKQLTHKEVPTWNYEMVQIKGIATVMDDAQWVKDQASSMTDFMEQKRDKPWKLTDAPEDYLDAQLKAIVGIEIEIFDIKGKWKMSQNKKTEDIKGVIDGLSDMNDPHANSLVGELVSKKLTVK